MPHVPMGTTHAVGKRGDREGGAATEPSRKSKCETERGIGLAEGETREEVWASEANWERV